MKFEDIQIENYQICKHQYPFKYLKKIQKYCKNITILTLVNIKVQSVGFKKKWSLYLNTAQIKIGWAKELKCPQLKRIGLVNTPVEKIEQHVGLYPDWQLFFEKHENLESCASNQPIYRMEREPVRMTKIQEITIVSYHKGDSNSWIFLRDIPTLKMLRIQTQHIKNIMKAIEEISKNQSLQEIEVYEEDTFYEIISLTEDSQLHIKK